MEKDLNYIAALEKAMKEKYGEISIKNPKADWNEIKEKEYIQLSKEKIKSEIIADNSKEIINLDGVLVAKKLINTNIKRKCEYCNTYSFNRIDNLFFTKFETCYKCYIKHIEDREDRWKQGWRPDKLEQK